ncbi:MAG: S1 family peptidase, partial [Polyangiales bacterium]
MPAVRLVTSVLVACGCAPDAPIQARSEAVVDGTAAAGMEAAAVVVEHADGFCTGSLVASCLVLTAKHCVQRLGADQPDAVSALRVLFGDSRAAPVLSAAVQAVQVAPGAYQVGPEQAPAALLRGADVALLRIEPVADVTPYPLAEPAARTWLAREVRTVGFGLTPESSSAVGQKAVARTNYADFRYDGLVTPATSCLGDSGGPLLDADGALIGVASFSLGQCGAGVTGYNRLDRFVDFIQRAAAQCTACITPASERCDGVDNDCDAQVDEGCAELGAVCSGDADCRSGFCEAQSSGRRCSRLCDASAPLLGCDLGAYCVPTAANSCAGRCTTGQPGLLAVGEACTEDEDCRSTVCAPRTDGTGQCAEPCRSGAGQCPYAERCSAPAGGCGYCVPDDSQAAGQSRLGAACAVPADCASGRCLAVAQSRYCTQVCSDSEACPAQYRCRAGQCVRGVLQGLGGPCQRDDDCLSAHRCVRDGLPQPWCTRACRATAPCPVGYACEAGRCFPRLRLLGERCERDAECLAGRCAPVQGRQTCVRSCSAQSLCPAGFECQPSTDDVQESLCVDRRKLPSGGCGCRVYASAAERSGVWCWLVLLACF